MWLKAPVGSSMSTHSSRLHRRGPQMYFSILMCLQFFMVPQYMYISLSSLRTVCVLLNFIQMVSHCNTIVLQCKKIRLFLHRCMFLRFTHAHEHRRRRQATDHIGDCKSYRTSPGRTQSWGRKSSSGRSEKQWGQKTKTVPWCHPTESSYHWYLTIWGESFLGEWNGNTNKVNTWFSFLDHPSFHA